LNPLGAAGIYFLGFLLVTSGMSIIQNYGFNFLWFGGYLLLLGFDIWVTLLILGILHYNDDDVFD